jgi:hypothetical protein
LTGTASWTLSTSVTYTFKAGTWTNRTTGVQPDGSDDGDIASFGPGVADIQATKIANDAYVGFWYFSDNVWVNGTNDGTFAFPALTGGEAWAGALSSTVILIVGGAGPSPDFVAGTNSTLFCYESSCPLSSGPPPVLGGQQNLEWVWLVIFAAVFTCLLFVYVGGRRRRQRSVRYRR